MNTVALIGPGDILKIQFQTLKADTGEVYLSNAYLNSSPVTELTSGTIIIKDVTPPTAAITYDDTEIRVGDQLLITATFDESMHADSTVKVTLTNAADAETHDMIRESGTVYTYAYPIPNSDGTVAVSLAGGVDLWGNEVTAAPASGDTFSIIPITYGDVDDDGTIFAYDAALTLQYAIGLDPLPVVDPLPWENWRDTTANVDRTGEVTANDAGMILQYSAGTITSFDTEMKKSAAVADVIVNVVESEIVFYSSGELIGLNVSTTSEGGMLGEPIAVAEGFLSAMNISGTTYRVGLCTSSPALEGDVLMKIPFSKSGEVIFDMVVNTELKRVTFDLATGETDRGLNTISIYPNPAGNILNVEGLHQGTNGRIFNAKGQMMISKLLVPEKSVIDVSGLSPGPYILKLDYDDESVVKRFAKD
jgi:hypothetical protein